MVEITRSSDEIDTRSFAGVGLGIPSLTADNIRMKVELTPTTPFYQRAEAPEYPFEALDTKSIAGIVKPAVDEWFKNDKNTERTAKRFGITDKDTLKFVSWTVLRTKALNTPKQITGGLFNNQYEIDVFIALGDWNESNGIFAVQQWSQEEKEEERGRECTEGPLTYIELRSGEDVSVNGADTLFFSGKSGGLALMLRLRFHSIQSQ